MKRIISFLMHAALLFTGPLFAQTSTPNIGLFKPAIGTPNWGPYINSNSDKIDAAVGQLQNPFQGAWVATTVYARGQFVSYNGGTYISLQNNNLNQNPATATAYWYVITTPSIIPPPGSAGTAPVSNGTAYVSTGVVLTSQINAANGVAGLDGSAKLATTQLALPGGTTNFLRADGTWAAPVTTGFATLNSNNFTAGSTQTLLSNNTNYFGNDPLLIRTLATNQLATIGFQDGGSGGAKWQIGKGLTNDFAIIEYANGNQVMDMTIGSSAATDQVTFNAPVSFALGQSTIGNISSTGTVSGNAITGTTGTFTSAVSVGGLTVGPGNLSAGAVTASSLGLTASLTGTTASFSGTGNFGGAVSVASLASTGAATALTLNAGSGKFVTSATAITETVPVSLNSGTTQLAQSFTSSNASGTQISLGGSASTVNNWLISSGLNGGLSFQNATTSASLSLNSDGTLRPASISTPGNIVTQASITASGAIAAVQGISAFNQNIKLAAAGNVFGICFGTTGSCIGTDPSTYNGIAVDMDAFPNRLEIHSVSNFTFFSGGNDVMEIDGGSGQVTLTAPLNFNGSQHVIPVTGGSTVPTYTFPVTISGIVYYLPLLPAAP